MGDTWFTLGLSEAYLHLRDLSGLETHMGKALITSSQPAMYHTGIRESVLLEWKMSKT